MRIAIDVSQRRPLASNPQSKPLGLMVLLSIGPPRRSVYGLSVIPLWGNQSPLTGGQYLLLISHWDHVACWQLDVSLWWMVPIGPLIIAECLQAPILHSHASLTL